MNMPETREKLISFLENAIVDYTDWKVVDSDERIKKYGAFWALLKSGAPFEVYSDRDYRENVADTSDPDGYDDHFWIVFPTVPMDNSNVPGDSYCFSLREKEEFNTTG